MTITFKSTNESIFDYEDFNIIVNPVNTVGVSGKGLALEFKDRYPDNYLYYWTCCQEPKNVYSEDNRVLFYKLEKAKHICNAATKDHWKDPSKLAYVERICCSLDWVAYPRWKVLVPALGCGCGGLDWKDVKEVMVKIFKNNEAVDWVIFEPKQ